MRKWKKFDLRLFLIIILRHLQACFDQLRDKRHDNHQWTQYFQAFRKLIFNSFFLLILDLSPNLSTLKRYWISDYWVHQIFESYLLQDQAPAINQDTSNPLTFQCHYTSNKVLLNCPMRKALTILLTRFLKSTRLEYS